MRKLPELHIDGYKEMSINKGPIEYLNPKSVFIPISFPSPCTRLKNEGDHVLMGEAILEVNGRFPYPILSPISGTIKGVVKRWHPQNKLVDMLEIENDFKEEIVDTFKGLDPDKMDRNELIEVMRKSGLVGMGGAGFPAYAKYNTKEKVDMIIINLAECEPFITCDYTCVLYNAERLVYGLRYLMKAAGSSKAKIAIKDKPMNKLLIEMITPILDSNMEISLLRDVYPAGWERYTVETVSKRTYKFLPIEAGVIVSNASTCYSFAKTLKEGIPPVEKYITITGDSIKNPGNVLVKNGTEVKNILPIFGGFKDGIDHTNSLVIAGGPMTGKSMYTSDFITTMTLGAIIVLEDKTQKLLKTSCLGCGRCTHFCPSFLSPYAIKKELDVGNLDELKDLGVIKCIQCGLCSFVCPSRIELTDAVGKAKDIVRKLGGK